MKPTLTNDERLDASELDIEQQFEQWQGGDPRLRFSTGAPEPGRQARHEGAPAPRGVICRVEEPLDARLLAQPGEIVTLPPGAGVSIHTWKRHATVWIDTEFNGWAGDLISIALVDDSGGEFYEALECKDPQPWVAEHVMPVIGKAPIALGLLQLRLHQWLNAFDSVHLVADWPDDIAYFCRALITGPGERLDTPALTMEIRRDLDATSAIPHNALEDAKAIRGRHLQLMASGGAQGWPNGAARADAWRRQNLLADPPARRCWLHSAHDLPCPACAQARLHQLASRGRPGDGDHAIDPRFEAAHFNDGRDLKGGPR